MAWRSSGSTNADMVSALKRFQVISSAEVEEGFRNVDRKLFVPQSMKNLAYKDQPIKDENSNIHISAPHIYGSVLEAMELQKDVGSTVLYAGSGTGYVACMVASILGPRSIHYCVEIHEDVLEHARESISRWKNAQPDARKITNINMVHGNALELDADSGECALGFDRIYVGAAVSKRDLPLFKSLLKPGGILVGPVDDELVKVIRIQTPTPSEKEYTLQVLSGVRFAPLVKKPSMKTAIQASIWSPTSHQSYPDSFRKACEQILLCSRATYKKEGEQDGTASSSGKFVNAASLLPKALWIEVLSFTHRDWFEPPMNEVEYLRKRLSEEQALTEKAHKARLEAENRCHLAERERDIYRLLATRWRTRLHEAAGRGDDDVADDADIEQIAAALLGAREGPAFGIGNLFRRFRARVVGTGRRAVDEEGDEEEDGDDLDEDNEDDSSESSNDMEEDQEEDELEEDEDEDEIIDNEMEEGGLVDTSPAEDSTMIDQSVSKPNGRPRAISTVSTATASTASMGEDDF